MQRPPRSWHAVGGMVAAAALVVAAAHGCDDTDPLPTDPPSSLTTGPGGLSTAGPGGAAGTGGTGGDEPPQGGQAPVYLGLTANPLSPDGEPTPSDTLLAELTVFAAGARSIAVDVPFGELDAAELSTLTQRLAQYGERDLRVVVTIVVVDRGAGAPPDGASWDDPSTIATLEGEIDALLEAGGEDLDVLLFGRALDFYLGEHPDEAEALVALASAGVAHVAEQSPTVLHGVGLRLHAGDEAPSGYAEAVALGNVLALSYLPGAGNPSLPADTSPAHDLDAMIALAKERPIVLQRLGFPSAATLGSAPELQAQRIEALMSALAARRSAFPIVNVQQLHDLDQEDCEALVAAQGLLPGDPFGDYVCTTGLRDTNGEPKPAWQSFIQASAQFAEP
jgi:hypothetical protein